MRIALIADIHSNLPALESVLRAIKSHSPDQIISLGDQVNLGPSPREVLALLAAESVTCLHGNHERYLLSAMAGDPAYDGANFNALRFGRTILRPEEITFPKELRMENAIFCHALPGDDRFPVFDAQKAIPRLLDMQRDLPADQPIYIFCGHGHNPTHISAGRVTMNSIGSVGCMDEGVPGTAPFAILDLERGCTFLRPYYTRYDVRRIKPLFRESGMAEFCPVMAHIICLQMERNVDILCDFVARALVLADRKGERQISEATWQQADAAYPWPDGTGTRAFWAK